jgi:hypothetical protein
METKVFLVEPQISLNHQNPLLFDEQFQEDSISIKQQPVKI